VRPRKKKPATKSAPVKRHWELLGQVSTDTKYLQDIPHYWLQMTRLKLPVSNAPLASILQLMFEARGWFFTYRASRGTATCRPSAS